MSNAITLDDVRKNARKASLFSVSTFLGSAPSGQKIVKGKITICIPDKTRFCDELTDSAALAIIDNLEEFKAAIIKAFTEKGKAGLLEELIKAKAARLLEKEKKEKEAKAAREHKELRDGKRPVQDHSVHDANRPSTMSALDNQLASIERE